MAGYDVLAGQMLTGTYPLTDYQRQKVVNKMLDALNQTESARDIRTIAKAMLDMDKHNLAIQLLANTAEGKSMVTKARQKAALEASGETLDALHDAANRIAGTLEDNGQNGHA